jgi:hypothetical protein
VCAFGKAKLHGKPQILHAWLQGAPQTDLFASFGDILVQVYEQNARRADASSKTSFAVPAPFSVLGFRHFSFGR